MNWADRSPEADRQFDEDDGVDRIIAEVGVVDTIRLGKNAVNSSFLAGTYFSL